MTIELSNRSQNIKPSATMALSTLTRELRAKGKEIIDLSVGEPDFDTPSHIKNAAIKAIQDGFTKYTAVDGVKPLKEAIIEKFYNDNALQYELDEILVSCGAKHSLYNIFQAILNRGDEVIIPAPYWASYPDIVKLASGKPVILKTNISSSFKINPEQLTKAISSKTKIFLINSPSNPSGTAYTKEELTNIADVLLQFPDLIIISDDIYEKIMWNHMPFANILNCCKELKDRTIIVNGVSKAYSMTGWRIGYAAGNSKIISAMKKIQSQTISHATSISQFAAIAALQGDQSCVNEMVKTYKKRHDFIISKLKKLNNIKYINSDGTFYSFIDVSCAMKNLNIKSDVDFTGMLLEKTGVAVLPGSVFGTPNHIRLSYATSMGNLTLAMEKLKCVL